MDWKEKIVIGISFIKEGCAEAGNHNCDYCPFEKYCNEPFPIGWDLKMRNKNGNVNSIN